MGHQCGARGHQVARKDPVSRPQASFKTTQFTVFSPKRQRPKPHIHPSLIHHLFMSHLSFPLFPTAIVNALFTKSYQHAAAHQAWHRYETIFSRFWRFCENRIFEEKKRKEWLCFNVSLMSVFKKKNLLPF